MAAGVLFDVDGTLVDTTYLHTVTWWQALRQHDHDVPMSRIHRAIGMGSDKILDALLGHDRDRGQDDELAAAHASLYAPYRTRLRPLPGARDLLGACAKRGWAVALASSASKPEFDALRTALDADEHITATTNADDVDRSKPDPDIVLVALERARIDRDRAVFVGDAVWDVYASNKLDIPCIGLTCGGVGAAELTDAGAAAVFDDPADLLANLDTLDLAPLAIRPTV
jgi:HAD superfamily hydrolase (TIGR01509 family)